MRIFISDEISSSGSSQGGPADFQGGLKMIQVWKLDKTSIKIHIKKILQWVNVIMWIIVKLYGFVNGGDPLNIVKYRELCSQKGWEPLL